jgi:tetratricopeptide (TPR) repeat protein
VVGDRRSGAALVLLVVLAHLPAVRAGWVWDDDAYVTENLSLRSVEGLRRIWLAPMSPVVVQQYYPLTLSALWLEYHAWGVDPRGYHVVNVLLHALSAVLLWRLLVALDITGAWVAAAVWAVHPVTVESVAWATELKNVLSAVLYLAAALAYVRFDPETFAIGAAPRRWKWWAAALALFTGALLAKTVTSTLPGALLVLVWWRRGTLRARDVVPLLPFFAAGAGMGIVTAWMEHHRVGAVGAEWAFTPAERLLIAGRAICFYAAKVVWPARLAFNYERWTIDAAQAWQWLFPAGVLVAGVLLFLLRRTIGRAPVAALAFFVGTLTPALGFFAVYPMRYSFVADHFQYLASIGIVVLIVGAAARAVESRAVRSAAAAITLAVLALLTSVRAEAFHDGETLWRDTIAKNPGSWLAHVGLMQLYVARGDTVGALAEAGAAVRVRPDDAEVESWHALTLSAAGRTADARRAHERAVALDPRASLVRYNYGYDLERWGEADAAAEAYRGAIAIDPRTPRARTRLGRILADRGDVAGAVELYREELAIFPDTPMAAENLAAALLRLGRAAEAESELEALLRIDPRDARARNMLASILLQRGDQPGAEREARRALADDPGFAEAHNTLGAVLATAGRRDEAIAEYRAALRLKPDYANAQRNLAAALAEGS